MDGLVLMAILGLILFLPTVIANVRHHHNSAAIFLVNLFFGWTVVGWLIAFIWACTTVRLQPQPVYYVDR